MCDQLRKQAVPAVCKLCTRWIHGRDPADDVTKMGLHRGFAVSYPDPQTKAPAANAFRRVEQQVQEYLIR